MHVNRTYRFRLYPTEKQFNILNKMIVNFQKIYSIFHRINMNRHDRINSFYTLEEREVLLYKLIDKYEALNKIPFFLLESASLSYFKDFNSNNKKLANSKKNDLVNKWFILFSSFNFSKNRFFIPTVGSVKFVQSRPLDGKIHSVRVFEYHNKWYISIHISYSVSDFTLPSNKKIKVIGIDLGISDFATLSDGRVINHPKYIYQYEDKINIEQKKLAQKEVGSKNWINQKEKLQKWYDKLKNSRLDFLHKTSSSIVEQYDVIGIESLSVESMLKNKNFSKSIYDSGLATFSRFIEYKSLENSKFLVQVDRFFPSSQICSRCQQTQPMPLSERTYNCTNCGLVLDRDINAARNIALYAKEEFLKKMKRYS